MYVIFYLPMKLYITNVHWIYKNGRDLDPSRRKSWLDNIKLILLRRKTITYNYIGMSLKQGYVKNYLIFLRIFYLNILDVTKNKIFVSVIIIVTYSSYLGIRTQRMSVKPYF